MLLIFSAIFRGEPVVLFLGRVKSTAFSAARKLETSKPYTRQKYFACIFGSSTCA